jgi:hypothetical protein
VGWVLGGAGARDTLEFAADVAGRTRDGRVEVVRLRRIASRPELRPHTLYRLTLDEEGRPVKVPVLDDVLDLRFHYLDRAARELSPPGGQESSRARRERATIRCIQVELVVAMQRSLETVADAGARGDPAHTRNALRLEAEIWPWNLGRGPHPGSS